ncbi:ribonuclease P protein component [candidate division WWE3 bacterium RBG_19FT_COMBO_34_6]|uniref:Ribonuclease P protein component n=1 Tax=candidate division WWE3 bacterium RBG_19FT_COMBO_34_6 TaxID=1802612 RepID=A0A1F4UNF7_UNCKA|nr:MAG: ribonuclease P protein component [candidate division WWE3 bacterium RBG_19FT_COMBO_34_6]
MLKKQNRLSKKFEFHVTKKYGTKINGENFYLYFLKPKNYIGLTKIGLVSSSKTFDTSVKRNRVKRIFREIFRKKFDTIPNDFWIIVYPTKNCLDNKYEKISADVDYVLSKIFVA